MAVEQDFILSHFLTLPLCLRLSQAWAGVSTRRHKYSKPRHSLPTSKALRTKIHTKFVQFSLCQCLVEIQFSCFSYCGSSVSLRTVILTIWKWTYYQSAQGSTVIADSFELFAFPLTVIAHFCTMHQEWNNEEKWCQLHPWAYAWEKR